MTLSAPQSRSNSDGTRGPATWPGPQLPGRLRPELPLNGHCRRCLNNRAVGCGQLVIRFGVPEGKSEVSYLSQFHLLNATDRVYLNL
jgi:hypothetical protein